MCSSHPHSGEISPEKEPSPRLVLALSPGACGLPAHVRCVRDAPHRGGTGRPAGRRDRSRPIPALLPMPTGPLLPPPTDPSPALGITPHSPGALS